MSVKIVKKYTAFSKKKGSVQKRITLIDNLSSVEDAVAFIYKLSKDAIEYSPMEYKANGFIYPEYYLIKINK